MTGQRPAPIRLNRPLAGRTAESVSRYYGGQRTRWFIRLADGSGIVADFQAGRLRLWKGVTFEEPYEARAAVLDTLERVTPDCTLSHEGDAGDGYMTTETLAAVTGLAVTFKTP